MEPILREHGTAEGNEILYFENAQIEKIKGNNVSFASMGTLSILYFKAYDRFVLMLNDWRYPLLRRLPIVCERGENDSNYILPANNGFSYRLNLGYIPGIHALKNFEKILHENSNFCYKGEESPFRKSEVSPDDKLIRHEMKDTGIREMVRSTIKKGIERAKVHTETVKSGTLGLESRKKALNLKELRNRNFRKQARCTFNKGFFETGMKLTDEFVRERTQNPNLIQDRNMMDLKAGYHLPRMYISKDEIENKILDYKELALKGNIHLSGFQGERERMRGRAPHQEHLGFVDSLKQGLREIKDTFSEMLSGPHVDESAVGQGPMERHERPRQKNLDDGTFDMIEHYQG